MWQVLYDLTDFLWGTPLMILMIGVGLYLTIRSGFFQFLGIPHLVETYRWRGAVRQQERGRQAEA